MKRAIVCLSLLLCPAWGVIAIWELWPVDAAAAVMTGFAFAGQFCWILEDIFGRKEESK